MSIVEKALRKSQESSLRVTTESVPRVDKGQGSASHKGVKWQSNSQISIDFVALRSAGLLPPESDEHQLAQQYRRVKRPLIANAFGKSRSPIVPNSRLIMVASAMAGEGKTFTSLNLALSLSLERDVRVLLVDADVAKPHISRLLGLSEAWGFLDALKSDSIDVKDLVVPTNVQNLSVLAAGTRFPDATELLASGQMESAVAALAADDPRRIVLFDSPPLLQTTESHALAQAAGQVVVVVRAGFTPQPVLLDALKILEGHPAVSLLLNQSMKSASSPYYYYGYGDGQVTGSKS